MLEYAGEVCFGRQQHNGEGVGQVVQIWAAKGILRGFDGHEQSAGLGKFTFYPVQIGRYAPIEENERGMIGIRRSCEDHTIAQNAEWKLVGAG